MDDRYIIGAMACVSMAFIAGIPIAHYWLIGRHVQRDDTDG